MSERKITLNYSKKQFNKEQLILLLTNYVKQNLKNKK